MTATTAAANAPGLPDGRSALDPAGRGAEQIAELWWFMLAAGGLVYAVVLAALFLALRRAGTRSDGSDRDGRRAILVGGVILPALVITATFAVTVRPGGPLFAMSGPAAVPIEVVAHQFWWSVRYPEQNISTANEIHIPVGTPVRIQLRSEDVVHSFWVPELSGKLDALPGKTNTMTVEATEPGIYSGACAEFCGVGHALMQLVVVAHPADEFAGWIARTAEARRRTEIETVERGRQVFMEAGCAACHTVNGTRADGKVGPDLTHIGSRLTLGAATIPNTRGHLGGWVVDPQSIKPGNKMPPQKIDAQDLPALLDYLQSLK